MLKKGTRILVTGGAGFIGSAVVRQLVAAGCQVRVFDDLSTGKRERLIGVADHSDLLRGDVRDAASLREALAGAQGVVHLAGAPGGGDPARAQEINLGGTLNLLGAVRQLDRRERPRVVLCGSGSVYGRQRAFVLHEQLDPQPTTPDAVMALAIEQYGRVFREVHGVPTVALRLFRTFGPEEDPDRSDAGVVARFVRAAIDGTAPVIYGDGHQTRDLIYIDNVVSAILGSLSVLDPPTEPLNIASGEAVAISFLWTLALELTGKKRLAIDPSYVSLPSWELRHARPQIARACKALSWAPTVRLREGLARTVAHYQLTRNRHPDAWFTPREEWGAAVARSAAPPPARRPPRTPPLPPRPARPARRSALELEELDPAELQEEQAARRPSELDVEWAPVPAVPGLGRP